MILKQENSTQNLNITENSKFIEPFDLANLMYFPFEFKSYLINFLFNILWNGEKETLN